MIIAVLGWCAFCIIEVFNDTCGLGMNVNAWFTGTRLMAFHLLYAFACFCFIYITPNGYYHII